MGSRDVGGRTGRPLGFDPHTAVDQAVEVFWAHGYSGATTTLLEEATSLSRSSLLNTFGPKEQLFLAVLDRYQQMVDEALIAPLQAGSAGLADIEAFFTELARLKASSPGSCGCLIVNAVVEQPPVGPEVQQRLDNYRRALAKGMSAAAGRAVDAGEISVAGRADRVEALVAIAIAVNWTARAAGSSAARRLARSVHTLLADWRVDVEQPARNAP